MRPWLESVKGAMPGGEVKRLLEEAGLSGERAA